MAQNKQDQRHQDNLDPKTRQEIGRKGGEAVSRDREHMAEIGRKGGEARSQNNNPNNNSQNR